MHAKHRTQQIDLHRLHPFFQVVLDQRTDGPVDARRIDQDIDPAELLQRSGHDSFHFRPSGYIPARSEEHTSELQSLAYLVCRLLLEKKKKNTKQRNI